MTNTHYNMEEEMYTNEKVLERLNSFLKLRNISIKEFANLIGVKSLSVFDKDSQWIIGRNAKLKKAFPQLNLRWLNFGEGEMYNHITSIDGYLWNDFKLFSMRLSRWGSGVLDGVQQRLKYGDEESAFILIDEILKKKEIILKEELKLLKKEGRERKKQIKNISKRIHEIEDKYY